ncbi:putative transcriptional regulatory protein [Pseudohongiella nitratireducens]|uniref:Probable transcriptional regulatory protein GCM10011403_18140 n=1 Tax=Pseudohongiella nitratireducens TaxID=1768907 RepID=A0A916QJB9_9GAMM|nr:YebC/PmpR family DNA-binding transcriptional regulator [Pseudohongiella nitratireducens]MDF1624574.1 YebC/PmpR family DNA-binding transcriptional regulator [Pseudohongiella nitratireducens]GFZ75856.1 putative transcriptional regulatory protein [Pseudohongiella nitratireducens]|tara:strand:- start:16533 stop:17264 length:732 start_codon:yes stop_codon:yes gene_type:complete
MGRAYQNRKESMAKTAAAKTKVYSKYAREIYVSAKSGGVDPDGNLSLRSLLERAKKDQVPSHVIDKAIEKAQGGAGEDFSVARYEGFGPGNCMVIVECLTDNPNRTFGDVRQCFTKTKCKIGAQGSVSHMFDHCAIFAFSSDDEEGVLEAMLNAEVDVTDIENEGGTITIFAPHTEYAKAREAIRDNFGDIELDTDEIQFLPQTTTDVGGDDVALFEKFTEMLNDLDDVQNIYHNAVLPEESD